MVRRQSDDPEPNKIFCGNAYVGEIPANNGNPLAPCNEDCPFHRPGVDTRDYSRDSECSIGWAEGHYRLPGYITPGPKCPRYIKGEVE